MTTKNKGTKEQDTQPNTTHNTQRNVHNAVQDPVSVPVYRDCELCDWDKGKSWLSLKMHQVNKHKRPTERVLEGARKEQAAKRGVVHPPQVTSKIIEFVPEPILSVDDDDEEDEPIEPEPTDLEMLNTILKDNGVKKRKAILRSMSIRGRDSKDLVQLMWALGDYGVNKGRQRRIIDDYSDWAEIEIPVQVRDEMTEPQIRSRLSRPSRWSDSPWDRDKDDEVDESTSGSDMVELANAFSKIYKTLNPRGRSDSPENEAMKGRLQRLEDELRRRDAETIKELKTDLKEVKAELDKQKGDLDPVLKEVLTKATGLMDGQGKKALVGLGKNMGGFVTEPMRKRMQQRMIETGTRPLSESPVGHELSDHSGVAELVEEQAPHLVEGNNPESRGKQMERFPREHSNMGVIGDDVGVEEK